MNTLSMLFVTALAVSPSTATTSTPAPAASTKSKKYKYAYSWKTETKMSTPRSDASATPTTANTILIAGGCVGKQVKTDWGYGCDVVTASAEIFDPKTSTFTATTTDMPSKRYRHTSAHVDGAVYVLGGTNLDYPEPMIATVDMYDVATSTWSTLPPSSDLPFATSDPTSFVIGTKIYYTGGYNTTDYSASMRSWVLDTQALSSGWKEIASAPTERGDAIGVSIDGVGYVFGGFTHTNGFASPVGTLESYSPEKEEWTSLKTMPTARGDKAGAVLHSRFHVIGGETKNKDGKSVPIKDVEVYDPVEKTWQDEGVIPSERFRFMAAAVDNIIYIFGGQKLLVGKQDAADSYYPVSDEVEAFVEDRLAITGVDKKASAGSSLLVTAFAATVATVVAATMMC